MKKLLLVFAFLSLMFWAAENMAFAKPCTHETPDKVLKSSTVTGKLKFYIIEDPGIPSNIAFDVNGKELRFVITPEEIEEMFMGKSGKKFQITYEQVYGWVGDSCSKYERIVRAIMLR